jgi:biopolymer transport protein ExbB
MDLVGYLERLMTRFGATWVMWLMIGLSVISLSTMLERGWFYARLRDDIKKLSRALRQHLLRGDFDGARMMLERSPSVEAAVVLAGLLEAERGAPAADEAMQGELALQRVRLEQHLAFLGTLGNNAPFIGLFGTVIGVVEAFKQLGQHDTAHAAASAAGMAPQEVMSSIAEALVATAVGLAVAIPAVAAYNFFQRTSRSTLANTAALSHVLLSYLVGTSVEVRLAPRGARAAAHPMPGEDEPVRGAEEPESQGA